MIQLSHLFKKKKVNNFLNMKIGMRKEACPIRNEIKSLHESTIKKIKNLYIVISFD